MRPAVLKQVADNPKGDPFEIARVAGIAFDTDMRTAQFAQLGSIDVDVDHLGTRTELGHLARGAIVETCADGDKQIAFMQRNNC